MFNIWHKYPYTDLHDLNLDQIMEILKEIAAKVSELEDWKEGFEDDLEKIETWISLIESGNLPPAMEAAIKDWCEENLQDLVGATIPAVFFGINEEGYFFANVPAGWSDLIFGTSGLDDFPSGVDYGHLTISY